MELGLKGKVALVTGGGRGIGKAVVATLAEEGATVVLNDREEKLAAGAKGELLGKGLSMVESYVADVSLELSVKKMVRSIQKKHGSLDILVNNAGVPGSGKNSISEVRSKDWERILNVNLSAAFFLIKYATPFMKTRRYGRIINISSIFALSGGVPGSPDYSASKSGLIGLTRNAALELGKFGITVNAILPGFIMTDMLSYLSRSELDRIVRQIPVRRVGTPQDVANLVCFLSSGLASYINGAVIPIHGGRSEYTLKSML